MRKEKQLCDQVCGDLPGASSVICYFSFFWFETILEGGKGFRITTSSRISCINNITAYLKTGQDNLFVPALLATKLQPLELLLPNFGL